MKNKLISLPCMEKPIRCYLTFANTNHQLSCNPKDGTIFTTQGNRKDWEEWNLIPYGTSTGYYIIQQKMSSRVLTISDDAAAAANKRNDSFNLISTTTFPSEQQNHSIWMIELYNLKSEHVQYTIRSAAYNDYYLCASTTTQNEQTKSSMNPKCLQLLYIKDGTQVENRHLVNIEYLTGELCFFSSPTHEKRLSCNPYGGLSMSSNWKGWEVFRIVEVGNDHHVRIMSWTHDTKVLYSDPEGKVLMGENKLGTWEKWTIELAPEPHHGVVVKSVDHGSYLRYDGNDLKTSMHIDASAVWDISSGHRQRYYISSISHDRRIGCDNGKCQIFCTTNRKDWEVWKMDSLERGMVSFQSDVNGKKYLSCDKEGNIKASDTVGKDETWKIKESSYGGFFIISDSGWYLACDGKGIYASKNAQGWESWLLEPVMPSTMTGNQIKGYAIGGAVALASVVLMPFAVMGAVGALGFTAEGIAGGSIAAGMMSAEAIASGGGVLAGGTVATLQSIGAAGLGAAGTAAAMGAGGAIGAAAIGISTIATAEKNKTVKEGEMQVNEKLLNRPFSSWKSWS